MKVITVPVNTNQLGFLPSLPPDQDESASSVHSGFHPSEPTEIQHTYTVIELMKKDGTLEDISTTYNCLRLLLC
jgi:hypothetical protein